MSQPLQFDLVSQQVGDTFKPFRFIWKNDSGIPQVLSGNFVLQIWTKPPGHHGRELVKDLQIGNGLEFEDLNTAIRVQAFQTSNLPKGILYWELKNFIGPDRYTKAAGKWEITPDGSQE